MVAPPAADDLNRDDVLGLQALRPCANFKLDRLAFGERPIAVGLNRREMHENILASLASDEPVSLCRVEPFHYALLSHRHFHLYSKNAQLGSREHGKRRRNGSMGFVAASNQKFRLKTIYSPRHRRMGPVSIFLRGG